MTDTTTIFHLQAPVDAVIPVISLSAPIVVGHCDSFDIDFSSSYGNGGRQFTSVSINVKSFNISSSIQNNIDNYITNNMNIVHSTLRIPFKSYDDNNLLIFPSNKDYVFEIRLCNFLLSCSTGSHRVYIQDSSNNENIPTSTIAGPSYFEMYRSQILKLSADAYISFIYFFHT